MHAIITHDDIWYFGKDICRILNLPSETIVQNLAQTQKQIELPFFKEDWSIERRETLVHTSGMLDLLKLGRNESVANWFEFFVNNKSESLIEQLESFGDEDCKINILYEG